MKRRILPILLSAALAFAMPMTTFAATPKELTQQEKDDIAAAHSYKAYQILIGDSIDAAGKIGDVAFGSDFEAVRDELAEALGIAANSKAKDFAEKLSALDTNGAEAVAAVIAKSVDKNGGYEVTADKKITGVAETVQVDGKDYKVAVGYYLVVDVTNLTGDDAVYLNRSQLQVVKYGEAIAIVAKLSGITSEKKVKDINDSNTDGYSDWQDSADFDVMDDVPFKLSATLPADYDYYTSYEYIFRDEMEKGLKFNNDAKVYVDGNEITEGFQILTENIGTDTFQVVFSNLKNITAVNKDSVITVEYTAKLDKDTAIYGTGGNKNKFRVDFKNNQDGKGNTPWDTVIVFTYKTTINKVKNDGSALGGAEFSLEKYIAETDEWVLLDLKISANEDGIENIFSASGLDDGKYRIVETKTPDGFNSIDPIYFEVTAEHQIEADIPQLTKLDAKGYEVEGTDLPSGMIGEFTIELEEGSITTDIINQEGVVLPSTGGIGTTIFYVIGGVLVVGAVVLLIVRRRMRNEEE